VALTALVPYAVLIFISYGTRGLQMLANAMLARSYGARLYTEYQACQQIVLSLFFYFSLGITYVFARQRLPPPQIRFVLMVVYGAGTICGAVISVVVVAPLFHGDRVICAAAIAAAYILYSLYGLLNASILRLQHFKRSAASGLLSPVGLMLLAIVPIATDSAGALLAFVSLAAPLFALVAIRRVPALYAPFRVQAINPRRLLSGRRARVLLHYAVYGLTLAAPVAAQGCIYSSFLAVAAYRSHADAESLATMLPLFSLIMISPQALVNVLLFKRNPDSALLILAPVAILGGTVLLAAQPLFDAVRWFMGYHQDVVLDPHWFVGFCVLMVVAKISAAIGIRRRQTAGTYVAFLSISCLVSLVVSLGLYVRGSVALAPAMFIAGLGALIPCLVPKVSTLRAP